MIYHYSLYKIPVAQLGANHKMFNSQDTTSNNMYNSCQTKLS